MGRKPAVFESSSSYEVKDIWFPSGVNPSPSTAQYLWFLAQYCEDAELRPINVCSLSIVRSSYKSNEGFELSCSIATQYRQVGFNNLAPTSIMRDKNISVPRELEVRSVEAYSAQIFVIRNKPGKSQDSLPKLFRKAAKFVEEQDLDFDSVESVRYVYGFDSKMRPLPELHIAVLTRGDNQ